MCFQELTIHFDYHNSKHCSCPVQVTTESNQLQYLILNSDENNCSRCFNASVNNYTVYVETDGGSLSNSLIVIYDSSKENITPTQTHMTSKALQYHKYVIAI